MEIYGLITKELGEFPLIKVEGDDVFVPLGNKWNKHGTIYYKDNMRKVQIHDSTIGTGGGVYESSGKISFKISPENSIIGSQPQPIASINGFPLKKLKIDVINTKIDYTPDFMQILSGSEI